MGKRHVDPVFCVGLCSQTSQERQEGQGPEIGFCAGFAAIFEQNWWETEMEDRIIDQYWSLVW